MINNKLLALSAIFLLSISFSLALDLSAQKNNNQNNNGNSGAIWTTNGDCGDSTQDENHYMFGDVVFLNGDGFNPGNYSWDITGLPGGASCDPNTVVVNGVVSVNSSGAFCFEAYTIKEDDCGEYKTTVGNKHDNYRVDETPVVPEFGVIAGSLTILGALAAFMLIRRN